MTVKKYFKHKSSYVDRGAKIGKNTKIWHFSHIMKGAIIGENCTIGQSCTVENGAVLGNGVKVQNNVSVYGRVIIEDDVFLGPSMVFTNDINPRSPFPKHGNWVPTFVKRGASIGANATIICGNTIGEWSLIGAGAVITKDVLPYSIVVGNPAKLIGFICECGLKMKNIKIDYKRLQKYTCKCGRKYKIKNNKVVKYD